MPEIVVVVTGPLAADAVDRWGRTLADAALTGPRRLIADLTDCPMVDAAAIVMLLRTHRQMVRAGGTLTLRGPSQRVRRTLRLARVDQVLAVEDPPACPAEPQSPPDAVAPRRVAADSQVAAENPVAAG
ncbi:hypothetical protein GCM10012284_49950 [Mangrovihabitans endophyticus]|uniref:STAS domain-containing protein n=1 Tax=Mangrovihabitans endophyticus TaxID=1751298 RepID=A0A8J3C511_9ACTN|nr:hypothetical protein GCM10012284_49950 [Mangrovihabitans endophyticus]